MPSLDPLHPLQSTVLEILAHSPSISTDALRKMLKKNAGLSPSVATLYRLLKELESEQVIVRSHGSIQLNAVWISHIARFVEEARNLQKKNLTSAKELKAIRDGERITIVADSLQDLDPAWNHSLLELAHIENQKTWYMYNSHPWYSLGMPATEQRLYQGLANEGVQQCILYGNDTFLDQYGMKAIRVQGMGSMCTDHSPLPKEGYALWLCGDYLVDCVMPEAISTYFGFFFKTVEAIDQFDPALFSDVFRMRAKCTLNIRKDIAEARQIRKMLEKFFGSEKMHGSTSSP